MKIATVDDIPEIADMSMKFMETTGYTEFSDRGSIEELILGIVLAPANEKIIVFEPGVGFIAGVATPFIFGPHRLATEVAWWVEPDHRNNNVGTEFLKAFEFWAKEKAGCSMISMVCLDDKLDSYYTKNGYKLYERAYMKVF